MSNDNDKDKGDTKDTVVSLTSSKANASAAQTRKILESIEALREQADAVEEAYKMKARIQRTRYNAYIEAGFTPDQALELCKHD